VAAVGLSGASLALAACGSAALSNSTDTALTCRAVNEQLALIASQANQVRAVAEANPVVAANSFAGLARITGDLPDCSDVGPRRAREAYLRALRAEGAAFAEAGADRPANPARVAAADEILTQARSALAASTASQSAAAASESAVASPSES
jgi:hypothetical protein